MLEKGYSSERGKRHGEHITPRSPGARL